MKGITLWQPYASAIFTSNPYLERWMKDHETRGWALPASLVGTWLFIHAAARKVRHGEFGPHVEQVMMAGFGRAWASQLPYGAIVGKVRFGTPFRTEDGESTSGCDNIMGDWSPGRWAWPVIEREALPEPIPAKGKQGWWTHDL